jgi:phosphoribosylformimino-5-aminoimidazole carboxamide ribotide isomerase
MIDIIPAIDLIGGKCVRLFKGQFVKKKVYSADPLGVAESFKSAGADWIHIIDLDGARTGIPENIDIATRIKREIDIRVEYGGGIRDIGVLDHVLTAGIDRPILGTKAIEDTDFLRDAVQISGGRLILSLDYDKDFMILIKGWRKPARISIFDLAQKIRKIGIKTIIATDVSRDGTLEGVDIDSIIKILKETGLRLFIAGGVTSTEDIKKLKDLEPLGIAGVIIGKAIYEDRIDLKEALSIGRISLDNKKNNTVS